MVIKKNNPNLNSELKSLLNKNPFSISEISFDINKDYFVQTAIEVIPIIDIKNKIKFIIKKNLKI